MKVSIKSEIRNWNSYGQIQHYYKEHVMNVWYTCYWRYNLQLALSTQFIVATLDANWSAGISCDMQIVNIQLRFQNTWVYLDNAVTKLKNSYNNSFSLEWLLTDSITRGTGGSCDLPAIDYTYGTFSETIQYGNEV